MAPVLRRQRGAIPEAPGYVAVMPDSITRLNAALEGHYRIERELGEGGMATVYLAHDAKHDRGVALKVFRPELAAALGSERFLNEIRITANLQHPHILPLFDSGTADSFLYYVMPHVAGETLRHKLDREGEIAIEESLAIGRAVASALHYAHSQNIVHRDIKPENVMLSNGLPVVADFGIAGALDAAGGDRMTLTGMSLGTPGYMSPEQAAGDPADARSDVYALGCLMFEMVTGRPPYQGPSAQALLAKLFTEPVPSAQDLRDAVPEDLDAAIRRALAKEPGDRFATAADMATALALGSSQPNQVREALTQPDKPSIAVLPFSDMTGANDQDYFSDGMVVEIVTALTRFQSLFVIASGTCMSYRGEVRSPGEIALELGVRYILTGSVRKAGERVRIGVELLDEEARAPIWSQRFDGTLEDVFALQDDVANAVASQIEPSIRAAEVRRAGARPTQDASAYDFYLRGLQRQFGRYEKEDLEPAIEMFNQAIAIDPEFAQALAHASNAHINAFMHEQSDDPEASGRTGLDLARRAVRAGGDDAEVLAWAAYTHLQCGSDLATVDAMLERALTLNPGASVCRYCSGWTHVFACRPEAALGEFETGLRLDPRSPWRAAMVGGQGFALFSLRRFDEAVPCLLELAEHVPTVKPMALRMTAACYSYMGRLGEGHTLLSTIGPASSTEIRFISLFRDSAFETLLRDGLALMTSDSSEPR